MLREASTSTGRRVTQEEVADKAGMPRSQVNPYFTDKRALGETVALRLAAAFTALGVADASERLAPPLDGEGELREILRRLEQLEGRLAHVEGELIRRLGPDQYRGHLRSRPAAR